MRSARDSLDLAVRRWSPLFPDPPVDDDPGAEPANKPLTHPLASEDLQGEETRPSTVVSDSDAKRRSNSSRARVRPGYVHSTRSPPSSVKGKFEGLEEQYKAIHDAQARYSPTLEEPPRISVVSPPISPMTLISSSEPTVPDFLKRPASRPPPLPPITPSLTLLHSVVPPRKRMRFLLPAVAVSLAGSLVRPFVSTVVGDTFGALAAFPRDPSLATAAQKSQLLRDVGKASIKLLGAAAVNFGFEYLITVA